MNDEIKNEAPMPLWWGWLTEVADEGAVCVAAPDEATATAEIRRLLCADDVPDGEEPSETTVRPVTVDDVDKLRDTIEELQVGRLAQRAKRGEA